MKVWPLCTRNEKRKSRNNCLTFSTFVSIAINVLGLIGLLSFIIEQKTKGDR